MENRSDYGVQLGRYVRRRREHLGFTTEQVWDRMEMSGGEFNWISQLENGRRKNLPHPDYISGLAQALRVSYTDVLRGAGVLPEDVEQPVEVSPGSQTIHALVDMIDWTISPENRMNVEGLLRLILERQGASSERKGGPAGTRAS